MPIMADIENVSNKINKVLSFLIGNKTDWMLSHFMFWQDITVDEKYAIYVMIDCEA